VCDASESGSKSVCCRIRSAYGRKEGFVAEYRYTCEHRADVMVLVGDQTEVFRGSR
jgi:hypothetical protein